jgi:hypothetical protein
MMKAAWVLPCTDKLKDRHFEAMQHYLYEHMYAYSIFISISERLSRLNFEIHKVGHQERLTIDGDIVYH